MTCYRRQACKNRRMCRHCLLVSFTDFTPSTPSTVLNQVSAKRRGKVRVKMVQRKQASKFGQPSEHRPVPWCSTHVMRWVGLKGPEKTRMYICSSASRRLNADVYQTTIPGENGIWVIPTEQRQQCIIWIPFIWLRLLSILLSSSPSSSSSPLPPYSIIPLSFIVWMVYGSLRRPFEVF